MIILLPPSEGKSFEMGEESFASLNPGMVPNVAAVLDHLKTLRGENVDTFYGVKDSGKAARVHEMNLGVMEAGCVPALERYTGVVYTYLDYASLRAKKRAAKRVHVVSGMFGLISGGTFIPPYKLAVNTWLRKYWVEKNTARLGELSKKSLVVSLLPQVYAKAVGLEGAVHVEFKVSGGKKLAGHFGKAVKGKFVRFLIEENVKSVDGFDGFREDGFVFDGVNFIQG